MRLLPLCLAVLFAQALGCDDDGEYQECAAPADCEVPEATTPACLPKSGTGFCTWECTSDQQCTDDAEGAPYICSPFEETPGSYCFPSCEGGAACPDGYGCRSTGGGSDNRQICFPL
jgi:hypothetical protein